MTIAQEQFDNAAALIGKAILNVKEAEVPDDVSRLSAVIFQCDVLKAAALSLATEIDFRANRAKETRP